MVSDPSSDEPVVLRRAEQGQLVDPPAWHCRILSPVLPGVEFEFMRTTLLLLFIINFIINGNHGRSAPVPATVPGPAGWSAADGPWPGLQAQLAHDRRDRVRTDPPALLPQIGGDPGRTVAASMKGERPGDRDLQLLPPGMLGRRVTAIGLPVSTTSTAPCLKSSSNF